MRKLMTNRYKCSILGAVFLCAPGSMALAAPVVVGMGDSIGEGVQAADAAWPTQMFSYIHLVSFLMGAPTTIPFIQTHLFGMVGNTDGRSRVAPSVVATNVAVSGADVNSVLHARADNIIDTETDLVISPRQLTQIESVEAAVPDMVLCWIGNNDVLSAAISFGNLDASQLTTVADFDRDYAELVDRLGALVSSHGTKVVFANIPDVTDIGFLVDRATAEAMLGFPVNLRDGHFTSIVTVLIMNIMGNDLLMNLPNFVLNPAELALIRDRTQVFNATIQREAARIGMPVVDMNAKFADVVANPPLFFGIPLRPQALGGVFSLDGVHPSNVTHALIANEFVKTMNQAFGMNVPQFNQDVLNVLYTLDPSIDKDGDGKATGRLGVGFVETLAFLFGITGDPDDLTPN